VKVSDFQSDVTAMLGNITALSNDMEEVKLAVGSVEEGQENIKDGQKESRADIGSLSKMILLPATIIILLLLAIIHLLRRRPLPAEKKSEEE